MLAGHLVELLAPFRREPHAIGGFGTPAVAQGGGEDTKIGTVRSQAREIHYMMDQLGSNALYGTILVIRHGQTTRDQIATLKRRTGIKHMNVLCRWALCRSLTHPSNDHSAGHHIMLTGRTMIPPGFNPSAPLPTAMT